MLPLPVIFSEKIRSKLTLSRDFGSNLKDWSIKIENLKPEFQSLLDVMTNISSNESPLVAHTSKKKSTDISISVISMCKRSEERSYREQKKNKRKLQPHF